MGYNHTEIKCVNHKKWQHLFIKSKIMDNL